MGQKVTISVPDDLHEKMEKWKTSFNFSGIFQEAVRDRINRKEAFEERVKKGEADMEAVAVRLKEEMSQYFDNLEDEGRNDGFNWGKHAHYKDIQAVLKWDPADGGPDDPGLAEEIHEIINSDERFGYFNDNPSSFFDDQTESYMIGWAEGVQRLWEEAQTKMG